MAGPERFDGLRDRILKSLVQLATYAQGPLVSRRSSGTPSSQPDCEAFDLAT